MFSSVVRITLFFLVAGIAITVYSAPTDHGKWSFSDSLEEPFGGFVDRASTISRRLLDLFAPWFSS